MSRLRRIALAAPQTTVAFLRLLPRVTRNESREPASAQSAPRFSGLSGALGLRATQGTVVLLAALIAAAQFPSPTPQGTVVGLLGLAFSAALLEGMVPSRLPVHLGSALAGLLLLLAQTPWMGALAAAVGPLCLTRAGSARLRAFAAALLLALVALAALEMAEASGLLWQELSRATWRLSYALTRLVGQGKRYGPLAIGGVWPAFAGCLWLAQAIQGRKTAGQTVRLFAVCVSGAAVSIATGQLIIMVAVLFLLAAFGDWSEARPGAQSGRPARAGGGLALVAISPLLLGLYCRGWHAAATLPRVAGIVEGGLKTLKLPSRTEIRSSNDAEFGALPLLLHAYRWETRTLPAAFSPEELEGLGVLCIINPTSLFSPQQQQAIESFVRRGGSLLVLGDHTDIGGIRDPLNRLLRFTAIRFEYDSALPTDRNWRWNTALRSALHPALWSLRNETIGIGVGASLACGASARVLVVGDRCFSDAGNPAYGVSHLGNMVYDFGEPYGGLPLVAEEAVGRGVVQVWGDTSGFQNSPLTTTHAALAAVFAQLHARRPIPIPRYAVLVCFLIASFAGLRLLAGRPALLFVGLVLSVLGFETAAAGLPYIEPLPTGAGISLLDASHVPDYPRVDNETWSHKFYELFVRRQELLLRTGEFPDLGATRPRVLVLMAPTRPYSAGEAAQIETYVREGGRLLLIGGHPHHNALRAVLDRFELSIAPDIFGAAHNARLVYGPWRKSVLLPGEKVAPPRKKGAEQDTDYDAELQFQESYPVLAPHATPLVSCWGRPIAVRRAWGRGSVTLISDSRFALDANLGMQDSINTPDVRFLLQCLEE